MSNEQNRPDQPSKAAQDAKLDDTLKETFPSSDAPANSPVEGSRVADRASAGDDHAKASPTSDREATEKAAGR